MYIHVRVIAGARKEVVERVKEDHYKIWVREKAERNLANVRVCELVAKELGVRSIDVRIINGHQSPGKLLVIHHDSGKKVI
jgi:uncharacterized protein YggU (UPF0235/DUF167 family)